MKLPCRIQFATLESVHCAVKEIGGYNAERRLWRLPAQEAIIGLKVGWWTFYVLFGRNAVDVIGRQSADGQEYLTTCAGVRLLSALPPFPVPRKRPFNDSDGKQRLRLRPNDHNVATSYTEHVGL